MWCIYILKSEKTGEYYKGITQDLERRILEHNSGLSNFTKSGIPWICVYFQKVETKKEALIEEKRIKRLNHRSLTLLISSN